MYEPSENFYALAVQQQVRRITWSGTITDSNGTAHSFGAEDIVKDSGTITNEIADSTMRIGTVFSSELKIGLYVDGIGVDRSLLYGGEIEINCTVTHGETTGTVPMGIFKIVEATQSGQICTITAYDRMILFDAEFPITAGQATPYDWLSQLCEACGVTLGNTQEEIEALPNGSFLLGINWTEDTNTYRDVLAQLSGALGCSAHFGRDGLLYLLPLQNKNSVATLDAGDRFGSDLAHTQWTPNSVLVTNKESGAVTISGSGQLLFNLGQNAFLQSYGYSIDPITQEITDNHPVKDMLDNILNGIQVSVVPIKADIPLDPCLDLFDIITLTGGQANNTKVLITSISHTIGGETTIECAGQNTTTESTASSRGSAGQNEDRLWVSGATSDVDKTATTEGENWVVLEYFERYFTQEFTLGVIGLTTEYTVDKDTEVKFMLTIEKWSEESARYTIISSWICQENALRGTHTTSLVSPFGILDNDNSIYKITAYVSGVDVAEASTFLTKAEIEALIGGSI